VVTTSTNGLGKFIAFKCVISPLQHVTLHTLNTAALSLQKASRSRPEETSGGVTYSLPSEESAGHENVLSDKIPYS
jgi:hypothetical protein